MPEKNSDKLQNELHSERLNLQQLRRKIKSEPKISAEPSPSENDGFPTNNYPKTFIQQSIVRSDDCKALKLRRAHLVAQIVLRAEWDGSCDALREELAKVNLRTPCCESEKRLTSQR